MSFFNLWAFGFTALAPVIVALYLLKVRRRPMAVSTLMFWQRVLEENQRRALFQKLRQWLSLLLHLLIFTLILLALARPTLDRAVHEGASTVIILDTRARMQATEADGEARAIKAQRAALARTSQASAGRQMAVLSAGAHAGVKHGFSGDEKRLRESIQATAAEDAGGDLHEAVALARDLLASRTGEKRIVVISDRVEPVKEAVEFVTVGTARENIAITRFAARPLPASPETFEILTEVTNFSGASWKGNLEIRLDGRLLDVRPVALAPGERKATLFPTTASAAAEGRLAAKIEGKDALPLDDVAYGVLRQQRPHRVLLVTKGNWFLEKLLSADARVKYELLEPGAFEPRMAEQFDATILDEVAQPRVALPATGNYLFIRQTPFNTGDAPLEQPLITDADPRHPALRLASLEHVSLARAEALALPADAGEWKLEAPLRFGEKPLLITGEKGKQRVGALAFGVGDSDLPLRVAFPLMMSGLLHWLAGAEAMETPSVRAGETMGGVEFLRNGFRDVPAGAGQPGWVPVNTFDERESDLRLASAPSPSAASANLYWLPAGWPLWRYLALAAAALLAGEWWFFHRRQTE